MIRNRIPVAIGRTDRWGVCPTRISDRAPELPVTRNERRPLSADFTLNQFVVCGRERSVTASSRREHSRESDSRPVAWVGFESDGLSADRLERVACGQPCGPVRAVKNGGNRSRSALSQGRPRVRTPRHRAYAFDARHILRCALRWRDPAGDSRIRVERRLSHVPTASDRRHSRLTRPPVRLVWTAKHGRIVSESSTRIEGETEYSPVWSMERR